MMLYQKRYITNNINSLNKVFYLKGLNDYYIYIYRAFSNYNNQTPTYYGKIILASKEIIGNEPYVLDIFEPKIKTKTVSSANPEEVIFKIILQAKIINILDEDFDLSQEELNELLTFLYEGI